jgi:cupin fold WbuC family metalloprotein
MAEFLHWGRNAMSIDETTRIQPTLIATDAPSIVSETPAAIDVETSATIIKARDLNEVAEGIFYSRHPMPLLNAGVIEILKNSARTNSKRRARFCAHPSPEADQHDMLIVSHRDTYVAPHRHLEKSESFAILEGTGLVLLFADEGTLLQVERMGPPASGRPFFYRMPPQQFHSLKIESELLIFLESTNGPFRIDEMENAAWAPAPNEAEAGRRYISSLLSAVVAN